MTTSNNMIKSLQGLRVLFALMVFYHHFTNPQVAQFGLCAVVAFFMLSGFVMSAGYWQKISSEQFVFGEYLKKRIMKVYPVYILSIFFALTYYIIHYLISGGANCIKSIAATLLYAIPSLFCVQSFIPISEVYFRGNAVAWFLSDIIFFYLIFPWIGRHIFRSKAKHNICTFIVLLLAYVVIMLLIPENWCHPLLYINPIFRSFDFIIGMYLYKLFDHLLSLSNKSRCHKCLNNCFSYIMMDFAVWGTLIIFLAVAEGMNLRYTSAIFWWIPIALLVLFYSIMESKYSRVSKVLNYISGGGKYTMEFYLFHVTIIVIWHSFLSFENWTLPFVLSSIACVILVSVVAYSINRFYEPYIDKKIKIWKRKKV